MTSIKISNQLLTASTMIDNLFIDQYMPQANGEFVKVYLYLMRMALGGFEPTIADMADALNNTENDIVRALKYWQKQSLLKLHCVSEKEASPDTIASIELLPITDTAAVKKASFSVITKHSKTDAEPQDNVLAMPPAKPTYEADQLTKLFTQSDMEQACYMAEVFFAHPLTKEDLETLLYFKEQLKFDSELIEHLIEYCAGLHKTSFRYMEKVAISWHENHIRTKAQAITYCETKTNAATIMQRCLGLNTWGEEARRMLKTWCEDYLMDLTLIEEACNRAYRKTSGNGALNYANALMENWHKNGITTLEQLAASDSKVRAAQKATYAPKKEAQTKKPANAFHNFDQGDDVDYDAILPKVVVPRSQKKEN